MSVLSTVSRLRSTLLFIFWQRSLAVAGFAQRRRSRKPVIERAAVDPAAAGAGAAA